MFSQLNLLLLATMAQTQNWQPSQEYEPHSDYSASKRVEARQIRHAVLTLPTSFENFTTAFEAKLSRYNLANILSIDPFDYDHIVETFTAALRGQPFAIFAIQNFGALSTVHPNNFNSDGTSKGLIKGIKYLIGNVVWAMDMTSQSINVELYVPPSIAVWENHQGWVVVEWDGLTDQIGDRAGSVGNVHEIAATIDEQREQVVWEVFSEAVKNQGDSWPSTQTSS